MSDLLEVGDTVITKTCFGENRFKITRVTKTLAKSKRGSDGYEHTFKRRISSSMAHPEQSYSLVRYSVERANKESNDES